MFGRRLALTVVKTKKVVDGKEELVAEETSNFAEVAENVVELAAGLGFVAVATSAGLASISIVEHIVKNVYR